jgi:hypothetical protein
MNVDDITESQLGTGHEWSKKSETTTTAAAALAAIDLGLLEDMDIDEETPGMYIWLSQCWIFMWW